MKIVHAGAMAWGENLAAHRASGIEHKVLFEGEEGSADNFAWVLAKEGAEYFSPRHRHVFAQVRFCLEGSVPVGRDLSVDAGEVAYFPEGVAYGPQEGGPDRIELLLQFGGASGQGYLSAAQVKRARDELAKDGVFEGGAYKKGGKNTDAYEAIWQHVTGRPIVYPPPRYKAPIVMRAENFPWREGRKGLRAKSVGEFNERGLDLFFIALEPGAAYDSMDAIDAHRLMFVRDGSGHCGSEPYQPQSAIWLAPGEEGTVIADADTELFVIGLAPVAML